MSSGNDGLCAVLFDVKQGTGVCEIFGPHDRHAGCVTAGVFRCHSCRRVTSSQTAHSDEPRCRCADSSQRLGLDRP